MNIELITSLIVIVVCLLYAFMGIKEIKSIIKKEKHLRELDSTRFHIYIKKSRN